MREALDEVIAGQSERKPELLRNLAGGDIYAAPSTESTQHAARNTQVFSSAVVIQIVNIWEAHNAYLSHIHHAAITAMAAQLMNTDLVRVWHDQVQYKPANVGAMTGWHQDHPAWPIIEPADLVTAWVALDDATIENGCMRMVPGSHRWGARCLRTGDGFAPIAERAVTEDENVKIEPIEVPAGHCNFHHCLTWHGSPPNPSGKPRRAIAVHYMPGHTRYVPKGNHPMGVRVTVKPGEILAGEYFPVVYDRGPLAPVFGS